MKNKTLIFLSVMVFLFSLAEVSCKKCQTCKVKDAVGNTIFFSSEQCETPGGISKYEKKLKETWVCYNYTVHDSDGVIILISHQICGHVDSFATIKDSLYHVFIADSPSVVITPLITRVECSNHPE